MTSEIRANIIKNRVGLGTIEYSNTGPIISGVTTALNFKTGTSNLHNTGLNVQDLDVDGHTNLDNVSIAGVTTTTDNIDIDADNKKLQIGASQDLQLFHDGGHSRITNTTGILKLTAPAGQSVRVVPPDDSGNVAVFHIDGSTHLYYDSAHKFSTLSDGIEVVGNMSIMDSIYHRSDDNTKIRFPANDTVTVETAGSERLRINSSGQLLVGATGNSTGGISEFSKSVGSGGAGCHITVENTSSDSVNNTAGIHLKTNTGTAKFFKYQANQTYLQSAAGGASELLLQANGAHPMRLYAGDAERVRILNTGDVRFYGNQTNAPNGIFGFRYDKSNDTDLSIENLDNSSVNNNAGVRLATNHGNIKFRYFNNGGLYIQNSSSSGYLHYYEGSDSRLYIDTSGNISINNGATPPSSNGALGKRFGIKSTANNVIIGETTQSGTNYGLHIESRQTSRGGNARFAQIGLRNDSSGGGEITFQTAASGADVTERVRIISNGRVHIRPSNTFYAMNSQSTDLVIGDGGGGRGITLWTAAAADNQTISFQTNESLSRAEGEISYGPTNTSTAADRNAMMFRTNSAERFRIDKNGSLTNTTNSSHSQGAGTFNVKGVINQYSQGSGSGLIFDCDFGRLTGYGDDTNVGNGTNLSGVLSHSTTDWASSNSNTPISVNGGTLQYRVGFGGYMEGISNGGRVSVAAGSGSPNMASTLNTASMTIESWVWYGGGGREVIASRWGTGFPYQFNMICDPNGQFHFNNSGVGCGSGNISGEHFPDDTWHHHVWQYDAGAGTLNRWYINGAFANSYDAGSSLAVSSNTGFGIFSRADDYERWRGKIAIVRIYNRALSATEIKNHFDLERGRFGV